MPRNVINDMLQAGSAEDAQFLDKLFPKQFRQLQMVNEVSPDMVWPMCILTSIQGHFRSPFLKRLAEQYMLWVKSKDRKGETVLAEYGASIRQIGQENE